MSETVLQRAAEPDLNACIVSVAETGDREAFGTLFSHFAPRIKAYLIRQGANAGTAEDIAQEAMLTVWRKAKLYDPAKASASTWIFTVARNLRIDGIRRERRPELDPEDPALVGEPEAPADETVSRKEEDALVREAITTLPEEQEEVLRLSFYEGKSHGVIAEELDLPLGTVKSRLRLAFRKIRNEVGESL